MFGKIIVGNTLDCRRAPIEAALQRYDSKLYLKWNPAKKAGQGVWEVRRRPSYSTAVHQGSVANWHLFTLEAVEHDMVHHILDVNVLDYRLPARIQAMDTWGKKNWSDFIDDAGEAWEQAEQKKIREDLKYNIRQHRREFSDLADLVARGMNPGRVLSGFTPTGVDGGFEPQNKRSK